MKLFITFLTLFFISLSISYGQQPNCDFTNLYKQAMNKIDTGYIFTKSFKLRPSDTESVNHTIVMVAGKNYHFYIESADTDEHYGIRATLRDETDKKVIATNFDANNKLIRNTISFTCTKTSIFHLVLDYSKAKTHCGVAVISFKKEEKAPKTK